MKNLLIILAIITSIGLTACTKKAPATPIIDDMDSTAMVLYSGRFMNGPYGVIMGTARMEEVNGKWQLRLDSLTVSNGPDLKVYLARAQQPVNLIGRGSLWSTSRIQVYAVNGVTDRSSYRYALIHCEKYNQLFGWSLLEMK